jgi:hypothetical protein
LKAVPSIGSHHKEENFSKQSVENTRPRRGEHAEKYLMRGFMTYGAGSNVMVKTLLYKPEGSGFETQ